MQKIFFRKAGLIPADEETFFLTSRHRVKAKSTIFHNNDYSTEYRIPAYYLKCHFLYDTKTKIYKTNLKNKDLKQFSTIVKHR